MDGTIGFTTITSGCEDEYGLAMKGYTKGCIIRRLNEGSIRIMATEYSMDSASFLTISDWNLVSGHLIICVFVGSSKVAF
jgi:hypothetical protein